MSKFNDLFESIKDELTGAGNKQKQTEITACETPIMQANTVTDKDSLSDYANAIADKAFADDKDEDIVNSIIQNAIKKSTKDDVTDWAKAAGIISKSF